MVHISGRGLLHKVMFSGLIAGLGVQPVIEAR